ncbi:hypothetical protein B0H13DRAFT_2041316 [Mycena leptocephala]|nr:hypothetical protein B0H13DRAFT_2041316 [Mycena leptocephala]
MPQPYAPPGAPHSVPSQPVPTQNIPFPPSAEREPVAQTVPNSGDEGIGSRPAAGGRNPLPRTQFGLNRNDPGSQGPPTDYRRKYAEDLPYKELDPEARVWHVYNDEIGDSLDILLVFAGLFSGVLTTFVAQTSQALSSDNTAISNSILLELVALQRAQASGTPFNSIPSADTSFTAARTDIWVNALWFTSLALSLTTALLAVLAKQWLRQYSSFIAGSARERALIRQFRFAGFDKWGVQSIIGLLPTILHLSLFLFMVGLVVFLYALDHIIAQVVASVAGFLFLVYVTTNVLPILAIGCPYRTPLTALLHSFVYGPGRTIAIIPRRLYYILVRASQRKRYRGNFRPKYESLRQVERGYVYRENQQWIHTALSWLASTTSDPSAKIILIEALGMVDEPLEVVPLLPAFEQQWENAASCVVVGEQDDLNEISFGRLVRSTVSSASPRIWIKIMLHTLPHTPIWAADHAMILAIAACFRTSQFRLGKDRPVIFLPPRETFAFVLDHYTVFKDLAVPIWMWLSIFAQAVRPITEIDDNEDAQTLFESSHCPGNIIPDHDKVLAYLRHCTDLRQAVVFHSFEAIPAQHIPVTLARCLAVFSFGRSLADPLPLGGASSDNILADPEHHTATSPNSSQALPDAVSRSSLLPTHYLSSPSTLQFSSSQPDIPPLRRIISSLTYIARYRLSFFASFDSATILSPKRQRGDPPLSHRPASSHSAQELPDTYSRTPDRNSPPLSRT